MKHTKNFKASAYSGEYEMQIGKYSVSGELSANSDRTIRDIHGQISDPTGEVICTFSAWNSGDRMRTSMSDIDVSRSAEIGKVVSSAINTIQEDIKED